MPYVYSKSKKTDAEDILIVQSIIAIHKIMIKYWTKKRIGSNLRFKPRQHVEAKIREHTERLEFWSNPKTDKFLDLHPHWVHKVWKD